MDRTKYYYKWLRKKMNEGKCDIDTLPPFVLGTAAAIAKKEGNEEVLHLLKAYRALLKRNSKEKQAKIASS